MLEFSISNLSPPPSRLPRLNIHIQIFLLILSFLTYCPTLTHANVEKIIFTVPSRDSSIATATDVDVESHSHGHGAEGKNEHAQIITNPDWRYWSLSHDSLRVFIHTLNLTSSSIIPSPGNYQNGPYKELYTITLPLVNLHKGKRYEVRIVWAATSPIDDVGFEVYFSPVAIDNPGNEESKMREEHNDEKGNIGVNGYLNVKITRDIWGQEDLDEGVLMEFVLDPYIFNILPESLLYIASMIILIAGIAWFGVSPVVYEFLAGYDAEVEEGIDSRGPLRRLETKKEKRV